MLAGRRVAVEDISSDHPAFDILEQFSGLHVGAGPDGEMLEEIFNDICFEPARNDDPVVLRWSELLDSALVGFAECHHRHGALFVSADGRVFCQSYMHDAFAYQADDFQTAIDGLLFGVRSKPMLRPDQESVRWYGIRHERGSLELYDYAKGIRG
ncbi:SUKH-3 domain-containing protein [Planctellipticum variicoloris]|uniref:SUKH-3 domain-containing protein n=1 Tax=Planctellipticum variicoloris TaxID=3064265 RepID=UPI0030139647